MPGRSGQAFCQTGVLHVDAPLIFAAGPTIHRGRAWRAVLCGGALRAGAWEICTQGLSDVRPCPHAPPCSAGLRAGILRTPLPKPRPADAGRPGATVRTVRQCASAIGQAGTSPMRRPGRATGLGTGTKAVKKNGFFAHPCSKCAIKNAVPESAWPQGKRAWGLSQRLETACGTGKPWAVQ